MALANHRTWLLGHAEKLFSFFERRLINPLGSFYELDEEGRPTAPGYDAADKPAGTISQPQGSFALTPPLISWVGQARTSSLITELVFCGVATATPTTLGTIGESAMTGHWIPSSRPTVTPSSCWPRQVPRSQGARVPIDFLLIFQRSYASGSGKSNTGLLRRNSPTSGGVLTCH
jgi:hypothetical protein